MTEEDRLATTGRSLGDAVRLAAEAPDAEHALEAVLEVAVDSASALAGAVVEAERQAVRALRGWDAQDLAPLLAQGGPVAEALARRESWIDRPLLLPAHPVSPCGVEGAAALLLLPLHVRSLAVGALVLALPAGTPGEEEWETARACAGLAGLVLEHERAAEDARAARQARDHFLTALNHEVRTPALALTLSADALRTYASAGVPAHVQKVLDTTQTAIATIVRVLEGVLQLGEKGVDPAVRGDVIRPREAVLQLLLRVEPAADRKGLPISFHAQRDLPPLQTDAARFSKVLLHLLSNAIKYTAEGSIEVRVERTGRWIGSGRRRPFLAVRVVDTGPGIPREVLAQMLEPFTQVGDSARTNSHLRGVGLGLPLARRLARSLGGELLLESDPGRGTVASLFLPYHR